MTGTKRRHHSNSTLDLNTFITLFMFLIYSFSIYSCVLHTQTLKLNQKRIKCTQDIKSQRRVIVVLGVGMKIDIFGWSCYFSQHFVIAHSAGKEQLGCKLYEHRFEG